MTINIRIEGDEQVAAKLEAISEAINGGEGMDTMAKALTYVHSQIPPESSVPLPAPGAWAAWARETNPAIFRAFFAKLNSGEWTGRTNDMMRSITKHIDWVGNAIVGLIGPDRDYAPWVISNERVDGLNAGPQAGFHAGRWFALQDIVSQAADGVQRIYQQFLREIVNR